MPSTSGTKTVTVDAAPGITAAQLTTLLALPIESLTVAQFNTLASAITRMAGGGDPGRTIGSLLV